MPQVVIHTMHRFFSIIIHLRKVGEDRMAIAPLVLLLPLSLGWPLAVWLAGGRGSSAASCLLITMWRTLSRANNSLYQCPPAAAKFLSFLSARLGPPCAS